MFDSEGKGLLVEVIGRFEKLRFHFTCNLTLSRILTLNSFLQDLDMDVEGKVSLHQLTNLLESVIEEQSDGKLNNAEDGREFVFT